jgi:hypothetical protein
MMDRRNTSGASLDVVSTPSIHDHLLVDEHGAKFDSVTGPTDGKPACAFACRQSGP